MPLLMAWLLMAMTMRARTLLLLRMLLMTMLLLEEQAQAPLLAWLKTAAVTAIAMREAIAMKMEAAMRMTPQQAAAVAGEDRPALLPAVSGQAMLQLLLPSRPPRAQGCTQRACCPWTTAPR